MSSPNPTGALHRLAAGAALAALLLAGCGDTALLRHSPEQQAAMERADRLAEENRPLEAARLYEELAEEAAEAQRFALATRAATLYLEADRPSEARRLLPDADTAPDGERWHAWAPVAARLALDDGRGRDALDALARLDADAPVAVRLDALELAARAHFALGDPTAGVRALLDREPWLDSEEALRENHRLLWRTLAGGGDAVLEAAERPRDDDELAGWLALGAVAVQAGRDPSGVVGAMARWRRDHPDHPAARTLADEVVAAYRELTAHPGQVALLLPLSGSQQGVGLAVRDGFLAAYFESRNAGGSDNGDRVRIRVYDTAEDGVQRAYTRAIDEGADFVVGPLLRDEVDAVAPLAGLVPTLALNNLSDGIVAPQAFYQFALSPEDEARQAARLAARRHGGRAVVLASSDDWGRRLLTAFTDELRAHGGRVLEHARYDNWEQDFSGPITRLLQLDQSQQRRRALADRLGMNLEFQPRRRQDADFVFLAARTPQARLIRPQLQYFYAADLPVYATSAVFQPDGGTDSDLNGIVFPDAPWLLSDSGSAAAMREELERHWPNRGRQLGRLYAMGFDGYRLVPLLFGLGEGSGFPALDGMSGHLSLAADGRVQRELGWAQFRGGRPQLLALPGAGNGDGPTGLLETGTGALRR